ncbi:hypothetical protein OUZ56_005596 [Daphnia magna]|uniref:Uncharacterized protein n=1 Tax=Daphnia magna TaxID=35525 RepID=A0ABQ9YT92_9CRUS|nr:hypothetical protein OUZ56_005596 [Daphnia magna]
MYLQQTTEYNFGPVQGREIGGASVPVCPVLAPAHPLHHSFCSSTYSLPTKNHAVVARQLPNSLRQTPLCPSINNGSAETPSIVTRQSFCGLCSFLPSEYLPVDPLTARQIARCSCPSTHSLPLPVDPLTAFARHITHSLCPSTPSLPVDDLSVRQNARCSGPSTLSLPLSVRPLIVCAR